MNILFHLGHPAQYHMFKHTIKNLQTIGHNIKITINTKDILEDLLIADGIDYKNILPKRRKKNTKWAALWTLIKKDFKILYFQWYHDFDMMVGTEPALAHVGWLYSIPVLIIDEDDAHVVPEAAKITFPFATHVVSPVSCDLGKYNYKKIAYRGYQKMCYLHPDYFHPEESIVRNVINEKEKYFLIRISALSAYGDSKKNGFTLEILRKIISILEDYGIVLISTERKLPVDFEQYFFNSEITNIHHFLFYSDLLISDSQSMSVEAAILGVPSIRFSYFAGKIGVLEELEHKYDLTYGISNTKVNDLYEKINEILMTQSLKTKWQHKRQKMLNDKIDVTAFWTWLIDSYPESINNLKEHPN